MPIHASCWPASNSNERIKIEHLTQVAERERITRDLHDLLGHTLTVIVLKSDIANRLFTARPELAPRNRGGRSYRPQSPRQRSRSCYWISCRRFSGRSVTCSSHLTSAGVQLTTKIEYVVLPSIHNILCPCSARLSTNVIRHADATVCCLELYHDEDLLTMRIGDNGYGELGAEGNGLRGMRERIASGGPNASAGACRRRRKATNGEAIAAFHHLASRRRRTLASPVLRRTSRSLRGQPPCSKPLPPTAGRLRAARDIRDGRRPPALLFRGYAGMIGLYPALRVVPG